MKERDITIDILKGIGITLMVVGHSGCPKLLESIIYSFHMPLFFLASGYFFKEDYICSFQAVKRYSHTKFVKLYIPYLKYSVLFLLAHNLFFSIGLLNSEYGDWGG